MRIRVWDLPTRTFHWLLVVLIMGLAITGQIGGDALAWHARIGYAVAALLLFRFAWGLVGGHYSRFASFFPTPARVLAYVRGTGVKAIGHNPLGAISVYAILGFLTAQVVTGFFSEDEIGFTGPLSSLVANKWVALASKYHSEVGKIVLIMLLILHVGAIIYFWKKKNNNLIPAMISGDKEVDTADVSLSLRTKDGANQRILAVVLLAIAAGIVAWVVNLGTKT
jgi:cytochrome b